MPTFTPQQIALGKAMGLSNVSSQNDLNQINAFAAKHGVSNVNSQNDLNALLPKIQQPTMVNPGSNGSPSTWTNPNSNVGGTYQGAPTTKPATAPGGYSPISNTATNGSSSATDFNALMMQQQQALQQQAQVFQQQQQAFAQQQAAQAAEMQAQLQAAQNAANAATPPGTPTSTSGWKPAEGFNSNASLLDTLLLGSSNASNSLQSLVIA